VVILNFFLKMVIVFLLLACAFGLYKIKGSDAYKINKLENDGRIERLNRDAKIAGPDLDDNGIRDDIDKYIRKKFKDLKQRKAVEQAARAEQRKITIDVTNEDEVLKVDAEDSRAFQCLAFIFNDDEEKYDPIIDKIAAMTFNTKARTLKYNEYLSTLSGNVLSLPDGDTCNE